MSTPAPELWPSYWPAPQGAESNYKDAAVSAGQRAAAGIFPWLYDEPVHHGIGRSRGGLSSKIHQLVDARGRPLAVLIGPGHANGSPMFSVLLAHLRVDRCGPGRPRTTPAAVLGKAYSARAHRALLRSRGIKTVIPQPSDQVRNRRRRGSRGDRPTAFDADAYRGRNVVERSFNTVKQWRGLVATRYDKLAIVYRGAAVLRAITIWLKHL